MANRFPLDRFVYRVTAGRTSLTTGAGAVYDVFADKAATVVPPITTLTGVAIPGARLTVGDDSLLPEFLHPNDAVISLWLRPLGSSQTYEIQALIPDQVGTITGGVPDPTNASLMRRDSQGRAQVVTPVASPDIATKGYVDTAVAASAHPTTGASVIGLRLDGGSAPLRIWMPSVIAPTVADGVLEDDVWLRLNNA